MIFIINSLFPSFWVKIDCIWVIKGLPSLINSPKIIAFYRKILPLKGYFVKRELVGKRPKITKA